MPARTFPWAALVLALALAASVAAAEAAAGVGAPVGRVAFVRFPAAGGHPRIFTVDLAGAVRPLPLGVTAAGAPAWSRRGGKLAFVGGANTVGSSDLSGADYLYVWSAARGRSRALTPRGARVGSASWAPDGQRLVYSLSPAAGNRFALWIVGAAGGRLRQLTTGAIDIEPSWSSDGRSIAFVRIDPANYRGGVWLIRPDGGGLRRLPVQIANATDPVWSPDGRQLLVEDGHALYSVRADGGGLRRVVSLAADAHGAVEDPQPAWSPDGRWIVFCQMRAGAVGRSDLWVVRPDGGGLRRLTRSPELDRDPSWGS